MSDKKPLISISIPIYNCSQYLEKCLVSLFEQTYPNIEYVFVDDCSADDSVSILKEILSRYPNRKATTKIIELEKNQGLANARTTGIKNMSGEYYTFCDGDDWIDINAITEMYKYITENNLDVVATPFIIESIKGNSVVNFKEINPFNLNFIPLDTVHFALWNKLFKASLFTDNDIHPYKGVNCWEDFSVTSRIFALTNKCGVLNKPFYHYNRLNENSLTKLNHKKILHEHLICADNLIKWFDEKGLSGRYSEFILFLKFTAKIKYLRGEDRKFKEWKETYPESNKNIMSYRNIPLHYRVLFWLANKF